MKTLILIRHAKSSWKDPTLADLDRPLGKRGRRDAPWMGKHLAQMGVTVDRCIVSPARRALETARMIALELDYPHSEIVLDGRLYEASEEDCLDVIHATDDSLTVLLLIGHNPGLQDTVEALAPGLIDRLPTCGLVQMTFDVASWSAIDCGALVDGLVGVPHH